MRLFSIFVIAAAMTFSSASVAEEKRSWSAEAKLRLAAVGECVATTSPVRAGRLMREDFTTSSYESGLKRLATDNRSCWRENRLRASHGLPFAGAISEALLKQVEGSLVSRVIAASGAEVPTYATLDRISTCIVRARPGVTASLLQTEIGSEAEQQAVMAMADKVSACSREAGFEEPLRNIRYLLATASYRLVAAHESQDTSNANVTADGQELEVPHGATVILAAEAAE